LSTLCTLNAVAEPGNCYYYKRQPELKLEVDLYRSERTGIETINKT